MKKIISVLLIILVLLSFAGCKSDKANNNSTLEASVLENKEKAAAEEAFWNYYNAFKYERDFIKVAEYSAFDMNKIFENTIENAISKKGLSREQVLELIRKSLNNNEINDFEDYATAFTATQFTNQGYIKPEQSKIDDDISIMKKNQVTSIVKKEEIEKFKNIFKMQRDSIFEATMIDLNKAISFTDDDKYISILFNEYKSEPDENGNQKVIRKQEYFLIKTESGWKVVDFNIVSIYSHAFKLIKQ